MSDLIKLSWWDEIDKKLSVEQSSLELGKKWRENFFFHLLIIIRRRLTAADRQANVVLSEKILEKISDRRMTDRHGFCYDKKIVPKLLQVNNYNLSLL